MGCFLTRYCTRILDDVRKAWYKGNMNNANVIRTENNKLVAVTHDDIVVEYSAQTDDRVAGAEHGKLYAKSPEQAVELAGELRAWGVHEARAQGYGVVFS
jgi:hypothetical protein